MLPKSTGLPGQIRSFDDMEMSTGCGGRDVNFTIGSQLAKAKARSEGWGGIIISIPLGNGIHGILAWIGPGVQLHQLSAVVVVNKPGIGRKSETGGRKGAVDRIESGIGQPSCATAEI